MDLDHSRERLSEERDRLQQLRSSSDLGHLADESENESLSELSHQSPHQGDTGTETFDRERDLSLLEQIDAELNDVEHALRRLDAGSYGTCEACNRPIDDARLEVLSAARFCLDDQATAEREIRSPS
jgi:RNA polymerase-binding transcription factor DksA